MQAFRLTDEVKAAGFSGGSIKATEAGHMFNIGEALMEQTEEGTKLNHEGVIVTDDDIFAEILASHPALEKVPLNEIPEGVQPVESPRSSMMVPKVGPFIPQTNDVFPGKPVAQVAAERAATEIAAEHADEPDTEEGAVAAGESVSQGFNPRGVDQGLDVHPDQEVEQ